MRNRDIILFQKSIFEWGNIIDKQVDLLLDGKIKDSHDLDNEKKLLLGVLIKIGDSIFQIEDIKKYLY